VSQLARGFGLVHELGQLGAPKNSPLEAAVTGRKIIRTAALWGLECPEWSSSRSLTKPGSIRQGRCGHWVLKQVRATVRRTLLFSKWFEWFGRCCEAVLPRFSR
jgi:hypothetical protein